MHIITYLYYILYFGYFTGIIGIIIGSIYGYNNAKNNITQFYDEFENSYAIINEYTEQIIKKVAFFGSISFIVGIILSILLPIFIIYLLSLFVYNRIINFFIK
jgi:uncharacterized protein YqhQ